jgi:hypothetical protein
MFLSEALRGIREWTVGMDMGIEIRANCLRRVERCVQYGGLPRTRLPGMDSKGNISSLYICPLLQIFNHGLS